MFITQILYSIAWVRYILNGNEPATPTTDVPQRKVCQTLGCKERGKRFLDFMDPNTHPCDDFFKFACGKFVETATIHPDKTSVSAFTKVNDHLMEQLRTIMSEPPPRDESRAHRSMRRLYDLCMDEDSMDARGVAPLLSKLWLAGGWPVLSQWDEVGWSVLETEIRLRVLGLGGGSLFSAGVGTDIERNSRRVLTVDQGAIPFQMEFLRQGPQHPTVQAYFWYMVDIAVMMGADRSMAEQDMWECLLFQIDLARIMTAQEERSDFKRMLNRFTLRTLQRVISWIDWYDLMRAIIPSRVDLDPFQEPGLVVEVEFFHKLRILLNRYPKRVIANYMMWDAVKSNSNRLTRAIRQRNQELMRTLTGVQAMAPRWKTCIGVASSFSLVISSMYVKKFFKTDGKKTAIKIVEDVRQEMSRNIDSLDWMDPHTKLKAKDKVERILEFIAYPDEILDDRNLERVYEKLTMNETHYLEATLDMSLWSQDTYLGQLHEPVFRNDWRSRGGVTDVNAYYDITTNVIKFPAGILQPPFFSADVPSYVNYATMGTIVGHEITHGFDNRGSQFDSEGNFRNWWDEASKRSFYKKTECMVNQYGNYRDTQTQMNINGNLTLGENVADNGGFKLAYNSWLRAAEAEEPGLPGMEQFTNQQLFMISIANLWCSKYRDQALRLLIMSDEHGPPPVRVNVLMQNLPAFSEAFGCATGRPMNPDRKCTVW